MFALSQNICCCYLNVKMLFEKCKILSKKKKIFFHLIKQEQKLNEFEKPI